jgi:tetratricopeptide (TPR) repeat protein
MNELDRHRTTLKMGRIGKRITGITLGALIGLGFLFARSSTPHDPEGETREVAQAKADKTAQRRIRKGPRKPPPSALSPVTLAAKEEKPEEPVQEDDGLTDRERKLEAYYEHLDAIEDPNVDELTMLGEMAFEANEAEAAYEHYLEVIEEHPDEPMAPFALYKLAWAEYNLGDVDAAIDDMELMMEWLDYGESPMEQTLRASGPADLKLFSAQAD